MIYIYLNSVHILLFICIVLASFRLACFQHACFLGGPKTPSLRFIFLLAFHLLFFGVGDYMCGPLRVLLTYFAPNFGPCPSSVYIRPFSLSARAIYQRQITYIFILHIITKGTSCHTFSEDGMTINILNTQETYQCSSSD